MTNLSIDDMRSLLVSGHTAGTCKYFSLHYVIDGCAAVEGYTNKGDGIFRVVGNKVGKQEMSTGEIVKRIDELMCKCQVMVGECVGYRPEEVRFKRMKTAELYRAWDLSDDLEEQELIENELRRRGEAMPGNFI